MAVKLTLASVDARLKAMEEVAKKLESVDFVALSKIDFQGFNDFSEMMEQVRKLYSAAKKYGPWAFTAIISTNVFGPKISAWLGAVASNLPPLPH